jgi:hypothetical protein
MQMAGLDQATERTTVRTPTQRVLSREAFAIRGLIFAIPLSLTVWTAIWLLVRVVMH